ncbi:MAG TPA: 2-C-methyl-D-erythritol 4-phosphate cytidylyltransferase, partial [Firmicutes bacterium]|nr:2-C-methyl-D-erythritol 4-phosphate cytidylyltransferase [Bacillota bacterium]
LFCQVIIVVPEGERELCQGVIKPHCQISSLQLVEGGPERQDSVFNGLMEIREDIELVCIHDGGRPLVSEHLITSVLEGAARFGAVIPGVAVIDTLKELNLNGTVSSTLPRGKIRRAQTPQAFKRELILEAYHKAFLLGIEATDDSYLLELLDIPVQVLDGDPVNIKITGPHDLAAAAAYLKGGR